MTCRECTEAMDEPRRSEFGADCEGCKARAMAAIGAQLESKQAGRMTQQYRNALHKMFGDRATQGHAAVLEWAGRIDSWDRTKEKAGWR